MINNNHKWHFNFSLAQCLVCRVRRMLTTHCTKYFCRRHFCGCKSLSLHLHTSTIFHQHVENHKTLHYTSKSGSRAQTVWNTCWIVQPFALLLLLLFHSFLYRFLCYFSFTRHRLVHAPQSGNKTEPILESQNNTETIFFCGCAHTFTTKQPQSSTICFSMVSMVRHESQKSLYTLHLIFYKISHHTYSHCRCKSIKRHSVGLFDVIYMRVNLWMMIWSNGTV